MSADTLIISWILMGIVSGITAWQCGRRFGDWFFYTIIFTPLVFLIILLISQRELKNRVETWR